MRIMPTGEVGRSVLGLTNIDGDGIAGLEKQYDEILTGVDGERIRERDRKGRSLPGGGSTTVAPTPGTDLVLTIDRSLQFQVETGLRVRVEELKAKGGAVVVMDSSTGDIYAMANVTRDDNGVVEVSSANLAAVEAFEPGSVAKVFSLAAVVDSGVATPDTSIDVPGSMVFNADTQWEQTIRDAEPHGLQRMTLHDVIVHSSNIGTLLFDKQLHGFEHLFLAGPLLIGSPRDPGRRHQRSDIHARIDLGIRAQLQQQAHRLHIGYLRGR